MATEKTEAPASFPCAALCGDHATPVEAKFCDELQAARAEARRGHEAAELLLKSSYEHGKSVAAAEAESARLREQVRALEVERDSARAWLGAERKTAATMDQERAAALARVKALEADKAEAIRERDEEEARAKALEGERDEARRSLGLIHQGDAKVSELFAKLRARADAAEERERGLRVEVSRLMAGMELAWGVIASAAGGAWDREGPQWADAAARWRDEHWHKALDRNLVPADDARDRAEQRFAASTPPPEGTRPTTEEIACVLAFFVGNYEGDAEAWRNEADKQSTRDGSEIIGLRLDLQAAQAALAASTPPTSPGDEKSRSRETEAVPLSPSNTPNTSVAADAAPALSTLPPEGTRPTKCLASCDLAPGHSGLCWADGHPVPAGVVALQAESASLREALERKDKALRVAKRALNKAMDLDAFRVVAAALSTKPAESAQPGQRMEEKGVEFWRTLYEQQRTETEKAWAAAHGRAVVRESVRDAALEEAAEVVEDTDVETFGSPGAYEHPDDGRGTLQSAAKRVRALKSQPSPAQPATPETHFMEFNPATRKMEIKPKAPAAQPASAPTHAPGCDLARLGGGGCTCADLCSRCGQYQDPHQFPHLNCAPAQPKPEERPEPQWTEIYAIQGPCIICGHPLPHFGCPFPTPSAPPSPEPRYCNECSQGNGASGMYLNVEGAYECSTCGHTESPAQPSPEKREPEDDAAESFLLHDRSAWRQCTSADNSCLGGCATKAEHERYRNPQWRCSCVKCAPATPSQSPGSAS
jgi:6,7-dimethyl-8-ribityllumazine synthase